VDERIDKIPPYCDFILPVSKNFVLLQRKSQHIGKMNLKEIGLAIKKQRAALGVNQRTVSELSGVAVNTLVSIERGEGNPQMSTLLHILDTIGLQFDISPKIMDYETM
jgi:DNA-binding XRE family transcriptional regulator